MVSHGSGEVNGLQRYGYPSKLGACLKPPALCPCGAVGVRPPAAAAIHHPWLQPTGQTTEAHHATWTGAGRRQATGMVAATGTVVGAGHHVGGWGMATAAAAAGSGTGITAGAVVGTGTGISGAAAASGTATVAATVTVTATTVLATGGRVRGHPGERGGGWVGGLMGGQGCIYVCMHRAPIAGSFACAQHRNEPLCRQLCVLSGGAGHSTCPKGCWLLLIVCTCCCSHSPFHLPRRDDYKRRHVESEARRY